MVTVRVRFPTTHYAHHGQKKERRAEMPTVLTQQQVDTIEEVAWAMNVELRSYSGRSMYGDSCLAIVLDSSELMRFAIDLHKADRNTATLLADSQIRQDSMGRDSEIIYWPHIQLNGTTLAGEDDDYE
jgi:hypothetical protein